MVCAPHHERAHGSVELFVRPSLRNDRARLMRALLTTLGAVRFFDATRSTIEDAGHATMTVRTQISFVNRSKFAWFWLYNVTKNPNGAPHLMLAIDEPSLARTSAIWSRSAKPTGTTRFWWQGARRGERVATGPGAAGTPGTASGSNCCGGPLETVRPSGFP